MTRIVFLVALLAFFAAPSAHAAEDCTYTGDVHARPAIKRGINLSRWWEDDRRQKMEADDIKQMHALGFDFVRLPLSPQWLELSSESEQEDVRNELRCDIIALLNENLTVIVDLHAMGAFQRALPDDADGVATRLESVWKQMLPVLKDLPPHRVLIGLFNEPHVEAKLWWDMQGRLINNLRHSFPHNPFVATAGPDGGPWDLGHMKPYDDKNVIYDFHFYQPMTFTHHAADWLSTFKPEDKTTTIPYPVMPDTPVGEGAMKDYVAGAWGRGTLKKFVDKIAKWAKTNHATVACLEFGVYRPYVDEQSRINWITDMREALEDKGIAWAMWEYRGGFGLIDASGEADDGIIKALGLKPSTSP